VRLCSILSYLNVWLPQLVFFDLSAEVLVHFALHRKKVVFVGVPGAFTPTCHLKHLPSYVDDSAKFKDAGVDIVFVSGKFLPGRPL
jgi:peroxiredoxin